AEQELISKVSMMVMTLERIVDRNSVFFEQRTFDVTEVSARTLTWLQQRFWLQRPADAASMQGHELAESLEDFIFGNSAKGQPRVRKFHDLVEGKDFALDNLGVIHDKDLIRADKEGGDVLAFVFSPDYVKKVTESGIRLPMPRPYGTVVYENTGFIKRAPPIAVRRLRQENPDAELSHIVADLDLFLSRFPELKVFLDEQKVKGYSRKVEGTTVQNEGLVSLRERIDELAYWTDLEPALDDLKDASIALTHRTVADNHTLEKYLYRYQQFLNTLESFSGAGKKDFENTTLESFLKYGSFVNEVDDEFRTSPITLAIQDALREINKILEREKEHGAGTVPASSNLVTIGDLRGWLAKQDAQLAELEILQNKKDSEKTDEERQREHELASIKNPEIRNNTLNLLQKTFDLIRLSDEFSIIERNRTLQKFFLSMQFVQNRFNGFDKDQSKQNALGLVKIYSREESYTADGKPFNARQAEYLGYTEILDKLAVAVDSDFSRGALQRFNSRGPEGRELYRLVNQLRFFNELEDYRREPQDEMASYLATHAIQFEVGADPSETRYLVYFGKLLSKVFNNAGDWERWLRTDFYTLLAADVFFKGVTSLHETGKIGEGERGNLLQQIQDVTNITAAQTAMKNSAEAAKTPIAKLQKVEADMAARQAQMQAMKSEIADHGYTRMYAFARERRRNDLVNEILTWRRYESSLPFETMTLGQLLTLANQVSGRKGNTTAEDIQAEEAKVIRDTEENFMTNFIRKRIGDSIELRAYFRRYQEDMARRVAERVDSANAKKLGRALTDAEKVRIESIALLSQSQIEGWISNEFEIDQKKNLKQSFEDFQKKLQDRFDLMEDVHFFAIYGLNSFLNFQQLEYIINLYYYNEKGEEFGFPSERLRSRFTGEANVFAGVSWTAEQTQSLIGQNIQQYLPRLDIKLAAPYFSQDPMLRNEGASGSLLKEAVLLLDATFQTEVDESIVKFVNDEFVKLEQSGTSLETVDRTNAVVLLAGVYDEIMSRVHYEISLRIKEMGTEELRNERARLKEEMLEVARAVFPNILRSVQWGLKDQNHVMGYLNAMENQSRLSNRDTAKYRRVRNRSEVDQAELDLEFTARKLTPILRGPGTMAQKLKTLAGSDERNKYLQALGRYRDIQGVRIANARKALKDKKILPVDIEANSKVPADHAVVRRFTAAEIQYREGMADYMAGESMTQGKDPEDVLQFKIELPIDTTDKKVQFISTSVRMESLYRGFRYYETLYEKLDDAAKKALPAPFSAAFQAAFNKFNISSRNFEVLEPTVQALVASGMPADRAKKLVHAAAIQSRREGLSAEDISNMRNYVSKIELDGWTEDYIKTLWVYRRYVRDIIEKTGSYNRVDDLFVDKIAEAIVIYLVRDGLLPVSTVEMTIGPIEYASIGASLRDTLRRQGKLDSTTAPALSEFKDKDSVTAHKLLTLGIPIDDLTPAKLDSSLRGMRGRGQEPGQGISVMDAALLGDLIRASLESAGFKFRPKKEVSPLGAVTRRAPNNGFFLDHDNHELTANEVRERNQNSYFIEKILEVVLMSLETPFVRTADDNVLDPREDLFPNWVSVLPAPKEGESRSFDEIKSFAEFKALLQKSGKSIADFIKAQKTERQTYAVLHERIHADLMSIFSDEDSMRKLVNPQIIAKNKDRPLNELFAEAADEAILKLVYILTVKRSSPTLLEDFMHQVASDFETSLKGQVEGTAAQNLTARLIAKGVDVNVIA
ncbi:MAG: hypothetical protein KBC91_05275, partial [Candidatus Omnitrophica bacterium]|nr:hypothetical protein [Candidatus Omnitrophota bacterium]